MLDRHLVTQHTELTFHTLTLKSNCICSDEDPFWSEIKEAPFNFLSKDMKFTFH